MGTAKREPLGLPGDLNAPRAVPTTGPRLLRARARHTFWHSGPKASHTRFLRTDRPRLFDEKPAPAFGLGRAGHCGLRNSGGGI